MTGSQWSPLDDPHWQPPAEFASALKQLCAAKTTPAVIAHIETELERLEQEMHDFVRARPGGEGLEPLMPWERPQDALAIYFDLDREERVQLYLNLFEALAQLDPTRCRDQLVQSVVDTAFDQRRIMLLCWSKDQKVAITPATLLRVLDIGGGADLESTVLAHVAKQLDLAPYTDVLDRLSLSTLSYVEYQGESTSIAGEAQRLRRRASRR